MEDLWPLAAVILWLAAMVEIAIIVDDIDKERMMKLLGKFWSLFGKNQWIGIGIYGTVIIVACVGTYMSAEATVKDLLGFLQWFAPSAVASLTVPSAAVKMRNGK